MTCLPSDQEYKGKQYALYKLTHCNFTENYPKWEYFTNGIFLFPNVLYFSKYWTWRGWVCNKPKVIAHFCKIANWVVLPSPFKHHLRSFQKMRKSVQQKKNDKRRCCLNDLFITCSFRTILIKSSNALCSIISMYKRMKRKVHRALRKTTSHKATWHTLYQIPSF